MRRYINSIVLLSLLLLSACSSEGRSQTEYSDGAVKSVFTDLRVSSCKEFIDQDDPNDTPYQLCPGVSRYTLMVRHVGSGRQSIDVVTPAQRIFPLDYHEFIVREMSHLGDTAEWRVLRQDGRKIPIALVVRVLAHENNDDPEQVTHSYLAVTKITPNEICVTDKIVAGLLSQEEIRNVADSSPERECLRPQPPLVIDGRVID